MSYLKVRLDTLTGETMVDNLTTQYETICEKVKQLRDNYMDFCEDTEEFNNTLQPIEEDPESYSNGTIKTKPILKKYACVLVEKNDLKVRLDTAIEAVKDINLTPQQAKADMKHYVSICEKKIAKQEEVCNELQKQVEQLTEIVQCITTHPLFNRSLKNYDMLTHCILKNSTNGIDFMLELPLLNHYKTNPGFNINDRQISLNIEAICNAPLHYACMKNDLKTIDILLKKGENIDLKSLIKCDELNEVYKKKVMNSNGLYYVTPLDISASMGHIELVKYLLEKGAKIGDEEYLVPNGTMGDLITGCLQTRGSKPVIRF